MYLSVILFLISSEIESGVVEKGWRSIAGSRYFGTSTLIGGDVSGSFDSIISHVSFGSTGGLGGFGVFRGVR